MKRKEFLEAQGFSTGRGRPSKAVMDALAAYRAEHGAFSDDKPSVTVVSNTKTSGRVINPVKETIDAKAVRAWARANNVAVGERGRLNPDVLEAYRAANGEAPTVVAKSRIGIVGESPLRFPLDARWSTPDKKYTVGAATACYNCRCSLAYHICNNAAVVSPNGNGHVPVSLI